MSDEIWFWLCVSLIISNLSGFIYVAISEYIIRKKNRIKASQDDAKNNEEKGGQNLK